jgi:hypothetical protein
MRIQQLTFRTMVMVRAKLTTGLKIRIGCRQILNNTPHPSGYAVEMEVQVFWSWLPNILSARGDCFVARNSGLRSRLITLHIRVFHFILKLHTQDPLMQHVQFFESINTSCGLCIRQL